MGFVATLRGVGSAFDSRRLHHFSTATPAPWIRTPPALPWCCHGPAAGPHCAGRRATDARSASSSRSSRVPSAPAPSLSGTPRITRCEAKVCRRTCQLIGRRPARLHARQMGCIAALLPHHALHHLVHDRDLRPALERVVGIVVAPPVPASVRIVRGG